MFGAPLLIGPLFALAVNCWIANRKFSRMKVTKINFVKEKIFLDRSLPGRDKIVNKIKDVVEQFGIL